MRMLLHAANTSTLQVSPARFRSAAVERWSPGLSFVRSIYESGPVDVSVALSRPGHTFLVQHFRNGRMLSVDAQLGEIAEVADWVVTSFAPADGGPIWLTEEACTGYRVVEPGVSGEQIRAGWIHPEQSSAAGSTDRPRRPFHRECVASSVNP